MRASALTQVETDAEPTTIDLDSLEDAEVQRLYRGTLRKVAADSRP
jgi:hypothetical protein